MTIEKGLILKFDFSFGCIYKQVEHVMKETLKVIQFCSLLTNKK